MATGWQTSGPSEARGCRRRRHQARWLSGLPCIAFAIGFSATVVLPRMRTG